MLNVGYVLFIEYTVFNFIWEHGFDDVVPVPKLHRAIDGRTLLYVRSFLSDILLRKLLHDLGGIIAGHDCGGLLLCDLLICYKVCNAAYKLRACLLSPFGEHPRSSFGDRLLYRVNCRLKRYLISDCRIICLGELFNLLIGKQPPAVECLLVLLCQLVAFGICIRFKAAFDKRLLCRFSQAQSGVLFCVASSGNVDRSANAAQRRSEHPVIPHLAEILVGKQGSLAVIKAEKPVSNGIKHVRKNFFIAFVDSGHNVSDNRSPGVGLKQTSEHAFNGVVDHAGAVNSLEGSAAQLFGQVFYYCGLEAGDKLCRGVGAVLPCLICRLAEYPCCHEPKAAAGHDSICNKVYCHLTAGVKQVNEELSLVSGCPVCFVP